MKWTPELLIAALILVICGALLGLGIDGEVKSILAMAAAWAFRSSLSK